MKTKILTSTLSLFILTGCTSSPVKYDPAKEARIRVFHDVGVYMHPNKTCFSKDKSEAIHASAGGFSMLVSNQKIGMPASVGMGRSYHEFVIRPGEPLTLEMEYAVQMTTTGQAIANVATVSQTTTTRCGSVGATLYPQAGKDYEASMIFAKGYCRVGVAELQAASGGLSKPVPITLATAKACQ